MLGTKIDYLYRDGANYKFWGVIFVSGKLSLKRFEPFLFHQEYFLPDAVGMRCLVPAHRTEDDHELHELADFSDIEMDRFEMSGEALLRRFKCVAKIGWFEWRERNGQSRSYFSY